MERPYDLNLTPNNIIEGINYPSASHKYPGNNGRFGDTELRNVNGEESHVNKLEALMIDKFGPRGEDKVEEMGVGTRNPIDGKPEYFPAAALLSAGYGIYEGIKGAEAAGAPIDLNQLYNPKDGSGHLGDWKAGINKQEKIGDDLMDVNSQYNQDLKNKFQQSGGDFAAMNNRMNSRNMSSGGVGGFSGIASAVNQSGVMQAQNQSMDAFKNSLLSNRQLGIGQLNQSVQGNKSFGETMGQGFLQNDALQRTAALGKSGGKMDGILGLLANPDIKSLLGG